VTKDPIGFAGGDTNLYAYTGAVGKPLNPFLSWKMSKFAGYSNTNLYQYSLSDPVNFTDSNGMMTDQERAVAARYAGYGALAGAAVGVCTSAGVATLGYSAVGAGDLEAKAGAKSAFKKFFGYKASITQEVKNQFIFNSEE